MTIKFNSGIKSDPDRKRKQVEFYGAKEVAQMLGVSVPTAREIMQRSDFPLIKVGRKLMVSKKALEEWADKRRV